jgi:hypothetical protein
VSVSPSYITAVFSRTFPEVLRKVSELERLSLVGGCHRSHLVAGADCRIWKAMRTVHRIEKRAATTRGEDATASTMQIAVSSTGHLPELEVAVHWSGVVQQHLIGDTSAPPLARPLPRANGLIVDRSPASERASLTPFITDSWPLGNLLALVALIAS